MGLFDRLFGKRNDQPAPVPEHAVIVRFKYGSTDLAPLFALEDELTEAILAAGAGVFDGNEVAAGGSEVSLYMYGPDADALFRAVGPALQASQLTKGARVTLRDGPPQDGVREAQVVLRT